MDELWSILWWLITSINVYIHQFLSTNALTSSHVFPFIFLIQTFGKYGMENYFIFKQILLQKFFPFKSNFHILCSMHSTAHTHMYILHEQVQENFSRFHWQYNQTMLLYYSRCCAVIFHYWVQNWYHYSFRYAPHHIFIFLLYYRDKEQL